MYLCGLNICFDLLNLRRRHKANKSDARSHYSVKSRYNKDAKKKIKDEEVKPIETAETEQVPEETAEETVEDEKQPESLEEFVYGDVQDFGEITTNQDQLEGKDTTSDANVETEEQNKGE